MPPEAELQWWYQYYFATERGRAGYEKYRREFAKLIWRTASPKWNFDDATFERSAASFDNPDHVAIVIHNYRWRLGLADGEPEYAELERRLAEGPVIAVPAITLEGDANGAPHPEPDAYADEVRRPVFAPDDQGRHRAQPSPGSSGGVRRRRAGTRSQAMSLRVVTIVHEVDLNAVPELVGEELGFLPGSEVVAPRTLVTGRLRRRRVPAANTPADGRVFGRSGGSQL